MAIIILLIAFLALCFICFQITFYSSPRHQYDEHEIPRGSQYQAISHEITELVDKAQSYEFERIYITSKDGLRLSGRYYHCRDGAPVVIMFHGYRSTSLRDAAGMLLMAKEFGFNAIMPDMRAHCDSQGRVICFGVKERYDCLAWVDYAIERFGAECKIALTGCSMGAATVMMASEFAPEQVKGLICDCGYSSPAAIIKKVMAGMKLPGFMYLFIRLGAIIFGGFDPNSASAVSALSRNSKPILIVHGDDDRFVPCSMAYECYAAASEPKRLFIVPKAGHGLSYLVDTQGFKEQVRSFFTELGLL